MNPAPANLAIDFTKALIESRFEDAHRFLSRSLRDLLSPAALEEQFRSMATYDEGTFTEFEEMEGMDRWPDMRPNDIRWAYVSVSGKSASHQGWISEAVQVVLATEDGATVIRSIEFGRP